MEIEEYRYRIILQDDVRGAALDSNQSQTAEWIRELCSCHDLDFASDRRIGFLLIEVTSSDLTKLELLECFIYLTVRVPVRVEKP